MQYKINYIEIEMNIYKNIKYYYETIKVELPFNTLIGTAVELYE